MFDSSCTHWCLESTYHEIYKAPLQLLWLHEDIEIGKIGFSFFLSSLCSSLVKSRALLDTTYKTS